jgi:predicted S18 family serine protease
MSPDPQNPFALKGRTVVAFVLVLALVAVTLYSPAAVRAATTTLTTSNGSATCPAISGLWDSNTETCTKPFSLVVSSGDIFEVRAGVTLAIPYQQIDAGGLGGAQGASGNAGYPGAAILSPLFVNTGGSFINRGRSS